MPYSSDPVSAEPFITHKGVTVYHTYEGDDIDNGYIWNKFTTDPFGGDEDDEYRFNVFSIKVPSIKKLEGCPDLIDHLMPKDVIVQLQEDWRVWREVTRPAIIREILIEAIEAGVIKLCAYAKQSLHDPAAITLEKAIALIKEVHDDVLAAHGVEEGGKMVLDEENLNWPDLAATHKKMAAMLATLKS